MFGSAAGIGCPSLNCVVLLAADGWPTLQTKMSSLRRDIDDGFQVQLFVPVPQDQRAELRQVSDSDAYLSRVVLANHAKEPYPNGYSLSKIEIASDRLTSALTPDSAVGTDGHSIPGIINIHLARQDDSDVESEASFDRFIPTDVMVWNSEFSILDWVNAAHMFPEKITKEKFLSLLRSKDNSSPDATLKSLKAPY